MSENNQNSMRQKLSFEKDLICPITKELPFDPVMAMDGQIYERSAIEKHFESFDSEWEITSPIANRFIITRLLPAVQHKNSIEFLLKNGMLDPDLVDKWNEKVKEKKAAEELLQKGESGDVRAMEMLGTNYVFGENGFRKDLKKAYLWFDQARQAGSVTGTARVGEALVAGLGVEPEFFKGTMYLSIAAERGSDVAANHLGKAFALGWYGVKIDKSMAIHWLEKVTSGECTVKVLGPKAYEITQELLDELKGHVDLSF